MSLKGQWRDEHQVTSIVRVCHRNSDFHNRDFVILISLFFMAPEMCIYWLSLFCFLNPADLIIIFILPSI